PTDDRYNYSRGYLLTRIAVALGGRVAEELVLGDVTTGAENDLEMATKIIRQMVTRWGMSERVGVLVQSEHPDGFLDGSLGERAASEFLAKQLDSAMQEIANERLSFTRNLLSSRRKELDKLAALLLEHESMDAGTICRELGIEQKQKAAAGSR
ncbi:MAG: cell division protein FtsH, partial [Chloroflexota bacterium]|nr:cell division protein FtsH [Chloroflexota bacterium]